MAERLPRPGSDPGPELLERWQRGDPTAFTAIFRAHRALVWRVLRRLLGNDPELEDVVQNAFLEVHRALPSFEGRSKLSSWIARVALNVGYHHLRRKKSRPADYRAEPLSFDGREAGATGDPETAARAAEVRERVQQILTTLPEKKRTVFMLIDLEGMAQEEVAEIVGASAATVRTRLFYARKAFWALALEDPVLAELEARPREAPGR